VSVRAPSPPAISFHILVDAVLAHSRSSGRRWASGKDHDVGRARIYSRHSRNQRKGWHAGGRYPRCRRWTASDRLTLASAWFRSSPRRQAWHCRVRFRARASVEAGRVSARHVAGDEFRPGAKQIERRESAGKRVRRGIWNKDLRTPTFRGSYLLTAWGGNA